MQKKIIAVAVAALASTAAFAQTNVTVYGVVDVQQAFVKSSGVDGANQGSVGRLDSHGNYIGFKGVEDLGNGLKAVFVYESALGTDNGGALSGGRDSYIGLAGGFGTIAAGNLTHPLRAFGAKVELLPGAAGFGTTASVTGTLVGIKTGADDRASNAVAYISPSFSGFTVIGAYVNGELKANEADVTTYSYSTSTGGSNAFTAYKNTNAKQYQIAAQYENGPLFVGAGYHKTKDLLLSGKTALSGTVGLAEDGQDARVYRVVAAYTFPTNTKVTALYDNTKVETGDVGDTVFGSYLKRSAASIGVAQTFGKNTVGLEYAKSFKLKTDAGKVDGTSSNIITAMYGYELSKRTMLHARVSRLNNGENVNNNFYNLPVANGVSTTYGSDYTGFSVGLRHTF